MAALAVLVTAVSCGGARRPSDAAAVDLPQDARPVDAAAPLDGQAPGLGPVDGSADRAEASSDADGVAAPGDLARRMARALWRQEPDQALLDAIAANPPRTSQAIEALAIEMLYDRRGRAGVRAFAFEWLGIDRLPSAFANEPGFTGLWQELLAETGSFVEDVVYERRRGLHELLLSGDTMLNESLARHYGVPGVVGPQLRRVVLDETLRAGVFTQGPFLAAGSFPGRTSPSRRGAMILDRLLCLETRPAPVGFHDDLPPATRPVRRWIEAASAGPLCAGCHSDVDSHGFAFEGFDQLGRPRLEDGGQPIDTRASLHTGLTVANARDLVLHFVRSGDAAECFVHRWFVHATGKVLPFHDRSLLAALAALEATGGGLPGMMASSMSSPAFLQP